jgi:ABC-type glycerol-3-phosphate transport system permease component
VNANGGKVSANFSQWWRVVMALAALLTLPLTVAFLLFKKPFIYAGFDNLDTDGTRIKHG